MKKIIKDLENKIPSDSDLVPASVPNTKIGEFEKKIYVVSDLVKKSDVAQNSEWNIKLEILATKPELKAEQDKMVKLQTFFLCKTFFSEDDTQNMLFISQNLVCYSYKKTRY